MSTFQYGANVRANGIRQHYLRFGGRGTPLVVVPGITSPAITWAFIAERLGERFDIYVIDIRGRGLSEAGPHLDYGIGACAADLRAFVAELKLDGCLLLGHSLGARITVASTRGDGGGSYAKVVLVDPPVTGPGRRAYPGKLPDYIATMRLMQAGGSAHQLRAALPTWPEAQLRLRAEWLHTCDERAVTASYEGFHQEDMFDDLRGIRPPTLLVVAEKGGVVLPGDVDEIVATLPSIAVRTVKGAGHMIPWDNFEGFFNAIDDFLGPASATSGG